MKLSKGLLNKVLLLLIWLLLLSFLFTFSVFLIEWYMEYNGLKSYYPKYLFEFTDFSLSMLFITNSLSSIVGLFILFATDIVTELRITWLLSFIFGWLCGANIFLLPLFRHYVVNKKSDDVG